VGLYRIFRLWDDLPVRLGVRQSRPVHAGYRRRVLAGISVLVLVARYDAGMTGHSRWITGKHREVLRQQNAEFPNLTSEQLQEMHDAWEQWISQPPPCGISYDDPYNPCMPERDEKGLICLNPACGKRQAGSAP
jgi:hypothetical protein